MVETPSRILVVDDEASITEFVSYNLRKEGYDVSVAMDGNAAVEAALSQPFDLIVLDVMLPGINGYEVCKRIRQESSVPVLFLSARDTEVDKVVGLEIGGDDYLAKPFGVRELLARVKALIRRSAPDPADEAHIIESSGIRLDQSAHVATASGVQINLTPREFELLTCLMQHAGKVLDREQLLKNAWGWEYLTETKTVDTHVKRLRDKLVEAGVDPSVVETVRGYGYRFKSE